MSATAVCGKHSVRCGIHTVLLSGSCAVSERNVYL